jgi:hypothetical protein
VYFLNIFEHNFFLLKHHETDFSLVFHPLRVCTTTPPDKQPPSYEENENVFKQKNRNVKGKTKINTNFEASHSLSLTSENCNYVVESKVQTPAQVLSTEYWVALKRRRQKLSGQKIDFFAVFDEVWRKIVLMPSR